MKKVVILISHIPDPRILKRVQTLENDFNIVLIYWDRGQPIKESFEINSKHKVLKIDIKAPLGKPLKRVIPLVKYAFTAIKILKDERPDIIHAGNLDMLLIAAIYKKVINKETRLIYEVCDLPKYAFVKKINSVKSIIAKFMQSIEKKLTSEISKIILTSPYFWDEYFSNFVKEDKYLFIPNAPSKRIFNKYEKKHHNCFTIGFIGSVRYIEQLKMLIDVAEELNKHICIKVFIAGNGPGYREILEYSKDKDFVEMYGPYNYEKEIVSLYERVDCIYSVYDTKLDNVKIALPNRLYEAIVCSIPIIAAKGTMLGKFVEENQIGVTVDSHDKEELKKALLTLIGSTKLMVSFRGNCDKIKSKYYYENYSESLLKAYKELIR